jgi:hypothetical protein
MSELITAGLVISKLSKAQEFASGDHVERIYGCQISLAAWSETVDNNIFTRTAPVVSPGLKEIIS